MHISTQHQLCEIVMQYYPRYRKAYNLFFLFILRLLPNSEIHKDRSSNYRDRLNNYELSNQMRDKELVCCFIQDAYGSKMMAVLNYKRK